MNLRNATTTASDPIAQLITKVMDRFDGNKDGQLTRAEFGNFLTGLLGGTGVSAAAASVSVARDPVATGAHRSRLAGFDFAKLDNPTMPGGGTSKYIAARIFQDYPPMPESLPAVVERLRAQGINARQTDFDKIDFGDGYGSIDVIQGAFPGGGVAWQWLPVGQ